MEQMKKLFYRLEADDYNVIMIELSECFEWIKSSCSDIHKDYEQTVAEEDMPQYKITPIWMTQEEFESLPEAE